MCVAKKYQLGGRFWTIAIVVGVMVACVSGMFGFGSVLREAAERSGNVVGFAKSQSLTYDSFNDSVAMTSQVLALENASQLAHSISYGGDEVDQADLERAARLLGVSNAFVLTVDGQLVSSYSNNNVTFGMVQHEITADVALDVVDHPRKVYGTRIVFDDGSYIDVGCAARIDQAGMVVAGYYTSEAFSHRYMLSLQNMLAGYDVRGSGDIVVATTRPETMMGDTGVAVNPEDEHFKHLIGKTCILPIMNREIPIVGDDYCEIGFGTGAVKMTPAHDPNDFEVGLRHNLEVIRVINDDGTINENGGKYNGMDRYECRKAIVKDLEEQGYLVKTEPYSHNVGTCYRCHNDVEPLISAQWFVKMEPLAKEAIRVVKDGTIKFVPERFTKTYINWMENVHDWCISRQLWWGHQIPAWYCDECGHINVSRQDPTRCEKCGCTHLTREEDVLDTWFSSALWPFSTLGWPNKDSEDLKYWYPTSVLVTGYDIIFFWVARMIFSGMEQMKQEPFKTVFIHGLVRDDKGRKMSKSLGNGIDPLEMADKFGADALRFNLITGNSPGNDMRFFVEKCEAMRNFANKIWNASRYVMMNLTIDHVQLPEQLELEDKWVLSKLNTLIREVTDNMEAYELGVASAKIYDFIWDTYCDWYIELTKARLYGEDEEAKLAAQNVLCYVLLRVLELLHPFMPFITEEIWQALPHEGDFLIRAQWPEYQERFAFAQEENAMEAVKDAISAVRARRSEMNVPPSRKAKILIVTQTPDIYAGGRDFIMRLAYASEVEVQAQSPEDLKGMVTVATHNATLYLPLAELVDIRQELERIAKEKTKAEENLARIEKKLQNESFVSKAPEAVVNAEREKADKARALIAKLEESAAAMRD